MISAAFRLVSTLLIWVLIWVVALLFIPVLVYYQMCWAKGNWPAGMLSLVLFSMLAPEGSVGDAVYFLVELVGLVISSIVYFLENLDQLVRLAVLLLFAAFATDSVFYLVARSRAAVAEEANDIKAQKEALDQRMAEFEDRNTTEVQKMNDWRQTILDWKDGEQQRTEDLEKACKHWQSSHGKLESENEEMAQRTLLAEKASQAAISEAKTLEKENASLKMKVSAAQRKQKEYEDIVRNGKEREHTLQSENADLKTEVGQLKETIAKLAENELKRDLEKVTNERDLYWEEGCKLFASLTAMTDERDTLRNQLSGMTGERDHLQQKLNDAIAAGTSLQKQLSEMTAHRDQLQQKLNDAIAQRNAIQDQLSEMTTHRDHLQQELNNAIAQRNALQNQLSQMTAHRDQLQQELNDAIAQRDALQNQLSEMTANRDSLQHELNKVAAERDMLLWKVDELEKEDEERSKKFRDAKTDKAKARGEATRLRAQLAEARKEIEALKGAGGSGGDGAGAAGDVPIDPALSNA